MLIVPQYSAHSYDYNDRVEKAIASLLSEITGLDATDFGSVGVPRPEYDFKLGGVQVELKTSMSASVPVELYKDDEETIPAGLLASTAPLVVTLSLGKRSNFGEVGKLRVFKRNTLLTAAPKFGKRHFYEGASSSQGSVTYSIPEYATRDIRDVWLGDVPLREIKPGENGYDLEMIFKSTFGGMELHEWIQDIIERTK